MPLINCPYCGAEVREETPENKVWVCKHCSHSLLVERLPLVEPIQSVRNDRALVSIGTQFLLRECQYSVIGFEKLEYKEGMSTEWHVKDSNGQIYYLYLEDENAYLLQEQTVEEVVDKDWKSLQPNTLLNYLGKQWVVTAQREMILSERGGYSTSNRILRSKNRYVYLVGKDAETVLLIFDGDELLLRAGFWLDPFDVKSVEKQEMQT